MNNQLDACFKYMISINKDTLLLQQFGIYYLKTIIAKR